MKEKVKLVILSHLRADNLKTIHAVTNASVCIPESQHAEYKSHNPDVDYILHPDSVVGLSPKIRWVYEQFPNVCMLDDDIDFFVRNYIDTTFDQKRNMSPEVAYDMIQSIAYTTDELGAKLFGLATSAKPVTFDAANPIRLSGFIIGGCVGFLEGFKMILPDECVSACDYFISGINAFHHRNCFVDSRFAVKSKDGTFKTSGGTADIRSIETEKQDYKLLRQYFGNAIQRKTTTVARNRLQNPYERSLKVPF